MAKNIISDFMTYVPLSIASSTGIKEAAAIMQDNTIQHLPVLENGKLKGIISSNDVKAALLNPKWSDDPVSEHMSSKVYAVLPSQQLTDVVNHMATHKIGSTVVQEVDGSVVGIFTNTDALFLLNSTLSYLEGDLVKQSLWQFLMKNYKEWKDKFDIFNSELSDK